MAVVAGLAFTEGILWVLQYRSDLQVDEVYKGEWFFINGAWSRGMRMRPLDGTGSRLRPGVHYRHIKKLGNDVVFDLHYTADANGFRVTAPVGDKSAGCVLFFGDSMMFGWGVNDEETAAYQVGRLSGGALAAYNFSMPSYSAHHMLVQIETGLVKRIAPCAAGKPVYVIEELLAVAPTSIISRSFSAGPRYLIRDGALVRSGDLGEGEFIADDALYIGPFWFSMLQKVQLYERTLGELRHDDFDTKRLLAIIVEARRSLERQFPGVKFQVVVWDDFLSPASAAAAPRRALVQALNREGIDAHGIDEILPDYERNPFKYCIAHEVHPTVEAHRSFAAYLVEDWMGYPLGGGGRQADRGRTSSKL